MFVVQPDNTAKVQPVRIDLTEGANLIVGSGLKAGDQVVVDGAERLKDGAKVEAHATQPNRRGNGPLNQMAPAPSQPGPDNQNATPNNAPGVTPGTTPSPNPHQHGGHGKPAGTPQ